MTADIDSIDLVARALEQAAVVIPAIPAIPAGLAGAPTPGLLFHRRAPGRTRNA